MDSSIPIEFDVEVLFHRAALRAVEAALTATHGPFYARTFVEDHSTAIGRLVRQLLHDGCKAQVAFDSPPPHQLPWRS